MPDLSTYSTYGDAPVDYSWLGPGVESALHAQVSGTLDVSKLTAGVHYDTTYKSVPAGLAVTLNTTSGLLEPWAEGKKLDGFLASNQVVVKGNGELASKITAGRFVEGIIKPAKLPIADQREGVKAAATDSKFTWL